MTPATRQIVFINTAHTITHYSLLILPTAVLAMTETSGEYSVNRARVWRNSTRSLTPPATGLHQRRSICHGEGFLLRADHHCDIQDGLLSDHHR